MIKTNAATNFQIKSNLARILATENIHIRHQPNAQTAAFDVKNRVLILPVWKDISNDLYDMLIVHEVGHALDTPALGWQESIKGIVKRVHGKMNLNAVMAVKDFLNVVEDARIEKKQKRRFPGSKRNFVIGYKELYAKDFFGLTKSGKKISDLNFIDRANIYFKNGVSEFVIDFSPEERVFIQKMEKLETWDEVVDLTEEIYAWAKKTGELKEPDPNAPSSTITVKSNKVKNGKKGKKQKKSERDIEMSEEDFEETFGDIEDYLDEDDESEDEDGAEGEDADGEEGQGSSKSGDSDSEGEETKSGGQSGEEGEESNSSETGKSEKKGQQDASSKDANGSGEVKGAGQAQPKQNNAGGGNPEDFVPVSETEKAAQEAMKNMVVNDNADYHYVTLPTFNHQNIIEDFSVVIPRLKKQVAFGQSRTWSYGGFNGSPRESIAKFNEWKNKEKDTISFMVKEFEMRKAAETYARIHVAKTGVLDTNKIHSYKFNDDLFRRMKEIPKGKNHGFVMIIDWSGSMEGCLKNTIKQLLSLTMFCRRINVPFEVFFFRSAVDEDFKDGNITGRYGSSTDVGGRYGSQYSVLTNQIKFGCFKLCNVLSSRMNTATFNDAAVTFWQCGDFCLNQDSLGSTPLNPAILSLEKVISDFRKKNKIEVVNAVVMTDGQSDPVNGIFGNPHHLSYSSHLKKSKFFLTDEKTRKTYFFEQDPAYWGSTATNVFLDILKERTKCNLIGFYLHGGSFNSLNYYLTSEELVSPANKKSWSDNKFVVQKNSGYDDSYLIDVNSFKDAYVDELKINANMKKSMILKEFIRYNGKKTVNRVLLSRFIEKISKNSH